MKNQSKLPPGAEPGPDFVRKEPQCDNCTHYESEHLDGQHCSRVMFYLPLPAHLRHLGDTAVKPRQLCDCKKFTKSD